MDMASVREDPGILLRHRDSVYAPDLLICAVASLDFFTFLEPRARGLAEICDHFSIVARPAGVMVTLFLALGLVEVDAAGYRLTGLSRRYLVSSSPESLVPYYASLSSRPQCSEFLAVLRTGKPAGWASGDDGSDWLTKMKHPQFADEFTSAMDSRGSFLSGRLAEKLDLGRRRTLLDVAGGSGIYACALAGSNPKLRAAVLEMSPVDAAAKRSVSGKGMSGRVEILAGDMLKRIPGGFDIHLFANVFHDWDEEAVAKLAANSYAGLEPGGMIVIFDAHLNEDGNGPLAVAEYSCLLMHSTAGRCYSTREVGGFLGKAGFTGINVAEIAAFRTVVTGIKR